MRTVCNSVWLMVCLCAIATAAASGNSTPPALPSDGANATAAANSTSPGSTGNTTNTASIGNTTAAANTTGVANATSADNTTSSSHSDDHHSDSGPPAPHKPHYEDCSIKRLPGWDLYNLTFCEEAAVNTSFSGDAAEVEYRYVQFENFDRMAVGHVLIVKNPLKHFTVVPPPNGCGKGLSTVANTAASFNVTRAVPVPVQPPWRAKQQEARTGSPTRLENRTVAGCRFATNAGFFNTSTSACYGNLVSDGEVIQTSDTRNAHFGIRDGKFVVGYLSPGEASNPARPFQQLVAGVVWVLRDGDSYVYQSANKIEDMGTQETGSRFSSIKSGRTTIGHNKEGHLVVLQLDGQSWVSGMDLFSIAELLKSLDVVNAINLDGGGSTTMTKDGEVVNLPTYQENCEGGRGPFLGVDDALFRCPRNVTSIICIHDQPVAADEEAGVAEPEPLCPALEPGHSFECDRCTHFFTLCIDDDTIFKAGAGPVQGWPQGERTLVDVEFLRRCEECCGCSQWGGSGSTQPTPSCGVDEPILALVAALGGALVMSCLMNVCMVIRAKRRSNPRRHFELVNIEDGGEDGGEGGQVDVTVESPRRGESDSEQGEGGSGEETKKQPKQARPLVPSIQGKLSDVQAQALVDAVMRDEEKKWDKRVEKIKAKRAAERKAARRQRRAEARASLQEEVNVARGKEGIKPRKAKKAAKPGSTRIAAAPAPTPAPAPVPPSPSAAEMETTPEETSRLLAELDMSDIE